MRLCFEVERARAKTRSAPHQHYGTLIFVVVRMFVQMHLNRLYLFIHTAFVSASRKHNCSTLHKIHQHINVCIALAARVFVAEQSQEQTAKHKHARRVLSSVALLLCCRHCCVVFGVRRLAPTTTAINDTAISVGRGYRLQTVFEAVPEVLQCCKIFQLEFTNC